MSAAQRVRSSVAADHRSAHPNLPGVPWWGAVLIAVAFTAAGFAFDAGACKTDLTSAFAALYIAGCVVAVLAVRQSGVFTAVVQPPLILFVAVPSAYYLFHGSEIHGIKDILINCGYPLIERFLLMFCTSVAVLLIGLVRWYFGAANRVAKQATTPVADDGAVSAVKAKVSALFGGPTGDDGDAVAAAAAIAEPPLKHGIDRPATARRSSKDRPTKRTAATRSRHARPPVDDLDAPAEPRRSRRPSHTRDYEPESDRPTRRDGGRPSERAAREWPEADSEARPRRRPRPPRESDQRTPPPRDYRRDPRDFRDLRDAREARDPRDRPEPRERPSRRPNRYEQSEAYEPYEPPPRRRPAPGAAPSAGGTHHPVSKVRYRGSDAEDGDNRVEYRTPPRRPRHSLED